MKRLLSIIKGGVTLQQAPLHFLSAGAVFRWRNSGLNGQIDKNRCLILVKYI